VQLNPPDLWPPVGLSEKEHEATKYLNAVTFSLRYFVEGFAAALELYRFSRSRPTNVRRDLPWKWQWFALHAGVWEVWNAHEYLKLVPRKIGDCATVSRHLDQATRDRALDLFKQYFPHLKSIRDAIGHAGIVQLTHDMILADGGLAAPQLKDGDRYEVVNNGRRFHFDMTDETLGRLTEVVTTYWAAFVPVEKEFDRLGRSD